MNNYLITAIKTVLMIALTSTIFFFVGNPKTAQAFNPFTSGAVSIVFDDGFETSYTKALPVLNYYNLPATIYITTGYIGDEGNLSWQQVTSLQNDYGWQIGSHSVSHADLAEVSQSKVRTELISSRNILTRRGLGALDFAIPYGSYNNSVLEESAKYYRSVRGFWDRHDLNVWPYDASLLLVQSVDANVPLATVQSLIDLAVSENKWLILVFHDIDEKLNPEYEYTTSVYEFGEILDYLVSSPASIIKPQDVDFTPGDNLVSNSSFSNNLSGWTTDNSVSVVWDSGNHGRYPSPINSVRFSGNPSQAVHLFSEPIAVSMQNDYLFKTFINSIHLVSGEFGVYFDEYDQDGNWISGQWKGYAPVGSIQEFAANYTPSSTNVTSISIQFYLTMGATGKVYLDETHLAIVNSHPQPTLTNLVANPEFDNLENGWASSWQRTSEVMNIVTTNGENAVHLSPNPETAHLFSENIAVVANNSYNWQTVINAENTSQSGEFGFYIDEYDQSGNWISGQWKGQIAYGYNGNYTVDYQPSSLEVDHVRLQYYVVARSSFDLLLTSVTFYQNQ